MRPSESLTAEANTSLALALPITEERPEGELVDMSNEIQLLQRVCTHTHTHRQKKHELFV